LIDEHDVTQRSAREAAETAAQRSAREAAAAAFMPPAPVRKRERRRVKATAALAVLVLTVLGLASYEFIAKAGHTQRAAAATHPGAQAPLVPAGTSTAAVSPATAATAGASPASTASTARTSTARTSTARTSTAPTSTASASTAPASTAPASTAPASPPPPRVLSVASVAAFGPDGTTDGDNPENVAQALAGDPANPWYTDWYASPDFFDMTPGTGLLLDLGRTVTVTSVSVSLGGAPGASLQLRAGSEPAPAWLPAVAGVSGAGGTVQLRPSAPVQVRYVLIWFTSLPPTPAGTYQASVYQVVVQGQP
jgi:hypothetical protein